MNASIPMSTVLPVPTVAAERFGKGLLLVNGVILAGVAFAQAMFDLSGAFLDLGPTARPPQLARSRSRLILKREW